MSDSMSGITLAQAQAQLDALLEMQATGMSSMSIGGRSYSFHSLSDMIEAINYWQSVVSQLQRVAAGGPRHDFAVADLSSKR